MILVVYLLVGALFAYIGAGMARSRGRDPAIWAVICFLFPLVGVIALALAGDSPQDSRYSNPVRTLNSKPEHLGVSKVAQPQVKGKAFDVVKWEALKDVDDDIASAVDVVKKYGPAAEDELAEKYFVLNDKAYLTALTQKIVDAKEAAIASGRAASEEFLASYMEEVRVNGMDPVAKLRVKRAEPYVGPSAAFKGGVKAVFENGTAALILPGVRRAFKNSDELDRWGA
jgi:hypothetical protein